MEEIRRRRKEGENECKIGKKRREADIFNYTEEV